MTMKIAIICYLFLMNVINFEAVAGLFQHKVDSLSLLKEAYRNRDEKTFFDLFPLSYAKFIEYYGYVENKPQMHKKSLVIISPNGSDEIFKKTKLPFVKMKKRRD